MMTEKEIYDIPQEKFRFINLDDTLHDEKFSGEALGFFKDAWVRLRRNRVAILAMSMILFIVFMSIFAPMFSGYGYNDQNLNRLNMPPRVPGLEKICIFDGSKTVNSVRKTSLSDPEKFPEGSVIEILREYTIKDVEMADVKVNAYIYEGIGDEYFLMGTDYLGRDLWTRLWRGARISLIIAIVAVSANIFIGVVYGAVAGYYGGTTDIIMMRITEIIAAFPQVIVATLLILVLGTGIEAIILALVINGWIGTAKLVRGQFLRFKEREYVLAARTLGVPDKKLIFRHILPNSIGPVITRAMISVPNAIFSESFLAFIGLGLQAPEPSIGVLLSDAQKVLLTYPTQTLFPAILISVLLISFNLFGNGLRDAFDPTMRGTD